MYSGYLDMVNYLFLQIGIIWVLGCSLVFCGSFIIGAARGGRAAETYTKIITWLFFTGMLLILAYGIYTDEFMDFLDAYGFSTLIELVLLALGCVWVMWFMATQYARSRIAIDEKFGSKEAFRAAKEAAKHAQENVMRTALADISAERGRSVPTPAPVPVPAPMPVPESKLIPVAVPATPAPAPVPELTSAPTPSAFIPPVPSPEPVAVSFAVPDAGDEQWLRILRTVAAQSRIEASGELASGLAPVSEPAPPAPASVPKSEPTSPVVPIAPEPAPSPAPVTPTPPEPAPPVPSPAPVATPTSTPTPPVTVVPPAPASTPTPTPPEPTVDTLLGSGSASELLREHLVRMAAQRRTVEIQQNEAGQ